jgi:competence protein ComEA
MKAGRFFNGWTLMVLLLIAVIIAGSVVIWFKSSRGQDIEITLAPGQKLEGKLYVGGAVNNPGFYPLFTGDGIEDVIRAAGGLTDGADLSKVKLTVSEADTDETSQKININRAEAWLLEALPGVGEARAQAIIEYRRQNGPFRDINELSRVPGLGNDSFNKIKNLITVVN